MANGSDLLNFNVPIGIGSGENISVPSAFPTGGPDLIGMGGAAISDLINNELGFEVTTPQEGSRFIEEGILGGNPAVVRDIVVDKVNNAPNAVKASIAGKVLGLADPAFAQIAAVNTANTALQEGGDVIQAGLQFGQEGLGSLSQRVDDSRFDFLNVPSTALAVSGQALGLGDRAIEGVQGIGQGFTDEVNVFGGVIYDQLGRPIGVINRGIDRGIASLPNIFRGEGIFGTNINIPFFGRDDDREDDRPVPVVVPVVSGPAGRVVDPGDISRSFGGRGGADRGGDVVIGGGGADASQPDFTPGNVVIGSTTGTTPGPAGMGFTPPAPRRRRRTPMGKAEGGLATIPRYLKGR